MSSRRTLKHSKTTERRERHSPDGGSEIEEFTSEETIIEHGNDNFPASHARSQAVFIKIFLRILPFCALLWAAQ